MTRAAMLVLVLLGRLALASGAGAQPEASQPARLGLAATAGTILGPPTVGTIATVPLPRGRALEVGLEQQASLTTGARFAFGQVQLRIPAGANERFRRSLVFGVTGSWLTGEPRPPTAIETPRIDRRTFLCDKVACPHAGFTLHKAITSHVDLRMDFQGLVAHWFVPVPRAAIGLAVHR